MRKTDSSLINFPKRKLSLSLRKADNSFDRHRCFINGCDQIESENNIDASYRIFALPKGKYMIDVMVKNPLWDWCKKSGQVKN